MVVDDDPSVLSLVAQIVADANKYDVLTASSGMDALDIAVERHVDLPITDSQMAGMDGSELVRRIKASGTIKRFLLISWWTQGAMERGVPFLAKPFRQDQLLRKVQELMAN